MDRTSSSPKLTMLVTGKCLFSFKANLWKMYEILVTPINGYRNIVQEYEDYELKGTPGGLNGYGRIPSWQNSLKDLSRYLTFRLSEKNLSYLSFSCSLTLCSFPAWLLKT